MRKLVREGVPRDGGHRGWLDFAGAVILGRLCAPALEWFAVHGRFLAGLGGLTLLAGLPLFQFKEMSGHDSNVYVPRFVEFYEGLKGGAILPRWAPDVEWGYGEPTFIFTPPLLHYLGALLHSLGFTFVASEDLSAFTFLLLAGLGMYLLAAEFFGRYGGLAAATAYVYAPFVLVRLYVNHSLADFAAFAFMPFAFWGLEGIMEKRSPLHWLIATLGVAALILSSTSVTVIVFPALIFCLFWFAWTARSVRGLLFGAWSLVVGVALAAFVWLPGLAEEKFVHITRREERFDYHDHFISLQQLIHSDWGYGLSPHGYSFELGPVHLLLAAAAVVLLRPIWRTSPRAGAIVGAFLILGAGAVFLTNHASLFIWDRVDVLHPMQFPWRFLSLVAFATAFMCGAPFVLLREHERVAKWLMMALIAAIFLLNFRHAEPFGFLKITDADYSPANIETKGLAVTGRELEPIDVVQFPPTPRGAPMTVLAGSADVAATAKTPTERIFRIRVDQDAQFRMNTFYFPGWTLFVDGERRPVRHSNPNGLMDFPLARGTHSVRFVFLDTPVRLWSTRLSLLAVLLLVATPAAGYVLSRRNARRATGVTRSAA